MKIYFIRGAFRSQSLAASSARTGKNTSNKWSPKVSPGQSENYQTPPSVLPISNVCNSYYLFMMHNIIYFKQNNNLESPPEKGENEIHKNPTSVPESNVFILSVPLIKSTRIVHQIPSQRPAENGGQKPPQNNNNRKLQRSARPVGSDFVYRGKDDKGNHYVGKQAKRQLSVCATHP